MKKQDTDELARRKSRLKNRNSRGSLPQGGGRMLAAGARKIEVARRTRGTAYGGLGLIHDVFRATGLADRIDDSVHVFRGPGPYTESDHVLNMAYNVVCGGRTLDDLELRRQNEALLDLIEEEPYRKALLPPHSSETDQVREHQHPRREQDKDAEIWRPQDCQAHIGTQVGVAQAGQGVHEAVALERQRAQELKGLEAISQQIQAADQQEIGEGEQIGRGLVLCERTDEQPDGEVPGRGSEQSAPKE